MHFLVVSFRYVAHTLHTNHYGRRLQNQNLYITHSYNVPNYFLEVRSNMYARILFQEVNQNIMAKFSQAPPQYFITCIQNNHVFQLVLVCVQHMVETIQLIPTGLLSMHLYPSCVQSQKRILIYTQTFLRC